MRRRWHQLTLVWRIYVVSGAILAVSILVLTLVAQFGGIDPVALVWVLVPASVVFPIGYITVAIIGRRQELDEAVQRGRRWDEEHGEDAVARGGADR